MQYDISYLMEAILKENQVVDNLVELALHKKQAIILGDLAELNEIMRQENRMALALEQSEEKRHSASLELARVLGLEDLTAASLIDGLRQREVAEAERLSDIIVNSLAFNLERLQDLNQDNALLLEQSLAFVESMEALLTRQRETTYSAGGAVKDSPTRSLLDKRI